MIKHIVMWTVKETSAGSHEDNARQLKAMLDGLVGTIPEVVSLETGVNELEGDGAMDVVMVSSFDTWEDLDSYQRHPEHQKVVEFVKQIRVERRAVDYTV